MTSSHTNIMHSDHIRFIAVPCPVLAPSDPVLLSNQSYLYAPPLSVCWSGELALGDMGDVSIPYVA